MGFYQGETPSGASFAGTLFQLGSRADAWKDMSHEELVVLADQLPEAAQPSVQLARVALGLEGIENPEDALTR